MTFWIGTFSYSIFFLQICDIVEIIFQLDIAAGKHLKYIDVKIVTYKT